MFARISVLETHVQIIIVTVTSSWHCTRLRFFSLYFLVFLVCFLFYVKLLMLYQFLTLLLLLSYCNCWWGFSVAVDLFALFPFSSMV